VIKEGKRLKFILRAGIGVDNIDVEEATKHGIIVMNNPQSTVNAVAELTIGFLFILSRKLIDANNSLKSKIWDREKFTGYELEGKTLGIIGLGNIGREVARKAKLLNMNVIAYDIYDLSEVAKSIGVEFVSFDEVLSRSDFISIHVPLTDSTRHIIGKDEFNKMKNGVKIINCARGGVIDEDALYEAIVNGKVSSAALDVFEQEPPFNSRLLELENVIVTPHIGAATHESQKKVSIAIVEQAIDALKYNRIRNAVNVTK
jgi:D-3-phosphoglycerate dehydrogenase